MQSIRLVSLLAFSILSGCSSQLTLKVVDAETHAPIHGAEVEHVKITKSNVFVPWATDSVGHQKGVDADGQVTFPDVANGDTFTITTDDYADAVLIRHSGSMYLVSPVPESMTTQRVLDAVHSNDFDYHTARRVKTEKGQPLIVDVQRPRE
jgi:hypothetical protein